MLADWRSDAERGSIVHNGRQLDDVVDDAMRMAAAAAVVTEAQADAAWASTERERQRAG